MRPAPNMAAVHPALGQSTNVGHFHAAIAAESSRTFAVVPQHHDQGDDDAFETCGVGAGRCAGAGWRGRDRCGRPAWRRARLGRVGVPEGQFPGGARRGACRAPGRPLHGHSSVCARRRRGDAGPQGGLRQRTARRHPGPPYPRARRAHASPRSAGPGPLHRQNRDGLSRPAEPPRSRAHGLRGRSCRPSGHAAARPWPRRVAGAGLPAGLALRQGPRHRASRAARRPLQGDPPARARRRCRIDQRAGDLRQRTTRRSATTICRRDISSGRADTRRPWT